MDDRRVVPFTLLAQAGVAAGLAGLLALGVGPVVGYSALLGGVTAVVPNAFLAARLVGRRDRDDAAAVLRSAGVGVVGKLAITALLFGTIFAAVRPVSGLAVFGGFIAAQTVVLGALLVGSGTATPKLGAKS
ncbi:MAG TPA: ATP synthase subunit I [Gammaproteobacteria bacterium]|nr:ATP synthase subunit I [Gammaproteobacteria bacterium]